MQKFTQAVCAIVGLGIAGSLLCLPIATAQKIPAPKVPDAIKARPDEEVVLLAHASGSQIYICKATEDKFSWTLKGPDAKLKNDKGKVIGSHFAGPTWKLKDGSELRGVGVTHIDSDDPNAIPWLRGSAVSHSGKNGLLTNVTTIQRVHTHGGKPPADGCDAAHLNAESKSSYTADYYFYAPAP